jgi:uncharacterized protein (TIGR02996 family)
MPDLIDGFLSDLVAHPEDPTLWLILADWLEDQGDPRCELARLRYLLQAEPEHPGREQRQARQMALLDTGLAPVVPTWTNALGMEFALILPGTFLMGSPETEEGRYDDEVRHPVTLTEPDLLGIYPVTVGEFARFVEATGYQTEAEKEGDEETWRSPGFTQTERHPVVCTSWNDTQAMIAWLNETSSVVHTLPTEAQWEYSCRAGSTTAFFWGDDAARLGEFGWFNENADRQTHPVTTKRPNGWGLWHVHGNVWEWCEDWYGDYLTEAVKNPRGRLSGGSRRVIRGGGWNSGAMGCRSAYRVRLDPSYRSTSDGFRLIVSLPVE